MNTHYDGALTMLAARDEYFARNSFGNDGGYGDAWVNFELGPIPLPFPNTAGRVRAVRYHDLHHVVTGYATDAFGELEISAWELGAGCRSFFTAWQLNLSGAAAGALAIPSRTFRAFVRGRRAKSLYGEPYDELLTRTVFDVRRAVEKGATDGPATLEDRARFALCVGAGLALGGAMMVAFLPLVPVGLVAVISKRAAKGTRAPA